MNKSITHALAVGALAAVMSVPAQAATTALTFSEVIAAASELHYTGTVGGDLTVSANSGKLVVLLGELGVSKASKLDPRINGGDSILFSFAQDVQLAFWDMDDLNFAGSNKFSLKVDGHPFQFSLDSHGPGSSSLPLIGSTFEFGFKGDAYMIDTLKFKSVGPTLPVPEASTWAMALAGLGVAGVVARRRRR